jgi:hypothetical protein
MVIYRFAGREAYFAVSTSRTRMRLRFRTILNEDLLALGIVTEGSTNLNDALSSVAVRMARGRQRLLSTRTDKSRAEVSDPRDQD